MTNDGETSLAIMSRAATMLVEATTIQKAKELKDLSFTAADYARRKRLGDEAIQHARRYGILAERRMGEMLAATQLNKGRPGPGRGKAGSSALPAFPAVPTLAEIGLTKRESSEAQLLAALPDDKFQEVIDGHLTIVQAKREAKEQKRENRRKQNREQVTKAPTIQVAVAAAKFATITIDPPWDWRDEGDQDQLGRARPEYSTMTIDQLLAFPLGDKADVDCHLYLWITNRSLPKGFDLIDRWGFRYVTCLTWCKPSIGMGNYFRGSTEQVLFAVKGSQPLKRKDVGTWFAAPRGPNGHSSKPPEFYKLVESCSPGPYLEVFAREQREGWTCWGGEL